MADKYSRLRGILRDATGLNRVLILAKQDFDAAELEYLETAALKATEAAEWIRLALGAKR